MCVFDTREASISLASVAQGWECATALCKKLWGTPRELREEGFVMEKTECSLQLMKKAGLEQSRTGPHIRYQASDSATILAMVREGLGITLVPRMMLPKRLEGVVALPLDPPPPLQIGLAVKSQKMASRGVKLFIQTALAWTQGQASLLASAR